MWILRMKRTTLKKTVRSRRSTVYDGKSIIDAAIMYGGMPDPYITIRLL